MLCIRINLEKELQPHKLSPDWKGAERVAGGEVPERSRRAEPPAMEWAGPHGTLESGVKIASLQFLPASFLTKTCHICIAKKQRAVRGAACLRFRGKIARCGLHILTAGFNCNMLQKKLTKHGNQFGVQRKANPYENPHWSGTPN